jgi:hypothetical protein
MKKSLLCVVSVVFVVFFYTCSYYQPEKKEKETVPPVKGLALTEDTLDITGVDFPEKILTVSAGERLKVDFGSDFGKLIKLDNLSGNSVYLVKVNRSSSVIEARNTGGCVCTDEARYTVEDAEDYGIEFALGEKSFTRIEHSQSQKFNHNPPPLSASPRSLISAPLAQVGDVKQFWVQNKNDDWVQIRATLRASSEYSNVWIAEENFSNSLRFFSNDNRVTTKQAQSMADKFDIVYEKETALFGHEFGGGLQETDADYGGRDGDVKIQILIYDIDYDYSPYQNSGVFGYFMGMDYYNPSNYHSNSAEIFYIDAHFMDAAPEGIYLTMAHEFQHMINFNEKYIKREKFSTTWFDEMLSQIAEDVISPFIGIDVNRTEHPVNARIPRFLASYWQSGFVEWFNKDFNESMISYSNTYAFGAYLVRNFGGAAFIKDLMKNDYTAVDAIKAALESRGFSFDEALAQYGEAFVFADDAHGSFSKTVTETINGTDYSFVGFDIWDIKNFSTGKYYGSEFVYPVKGPVIIDTSFISMMRPYSVFVQSGAEWKNVSGSLTFKLRRPNDDSIDFYIIVK